MAALITTHGFHFAQPWWLLLGLLAVPMIYFGWRNLAALGRSRQVIAAVLRGIVVLLLAAMLARPMLTTTNEQMTVIVVLDRSQSIPDSLQKGSQSFLEQALPHKDPRDQLAVIDLAEAASISKLPTTDVALRQRNTSLTGLETRLSAGVDMAMAIAPPNSAVRILLVSDGNETAGDVRESARAAAANGIPIDVLPLQYKYGQEVVFKNLVAPVRARSGQTVPLRFVLSSTGQARGQLLLTLNGKPVHLDPSSPNVSVPVTLKPGTNVKTVSLPMGSRGIHEFEATFIPDDKGQDSLEQNNKASAITFVAGPGHVLVVDSDDAAGSAITRALKEAQIDVRHSSVADFPARLVELMDCDAVVLANVNSAAITYKQHEMLARYVSEMGGGVVMTGGPDSFGAGGWIGSPLAEVMPLDMDPPQKKQIPKGALALIMHACEMPNGNYWGKQVALAAVNTLSRLDLAGVLDYHWQGGGNGTWVYPLSEVGDKSAITAAINKMEMGDMPDFGAPMQEAYQALSKANAAAKHVIIISDGDPQMPSQQLLADYKKAGITVTGVAVFPHQANTTQSLAAIAQATGGRFYDVKDAQSLPQIFMKEAQVVRRALIVEETVTPKITFSMNEVVRGLEGVPSVDGYVLTGPKGGLAQLIMAAPNGDPIMAAGQSGLGRCVAFTSTADSRWGKMWMGWGGFNRFWEQVIRWVGKSSQSSDCEVFADVQGRNVTLTVEAADAGGKFLQLSQIAAQIIAPDMTIQELGLAQVGPGRYRGEFQASAGGSYLVNLKYRKAGDEGKDSKPAMMYSAISVPYAPEFRDLTDNTPLLSEVASMTGGRMIGPNPATAGIFDRSKVRFPQSAMPLTTPLLLVWLGLFLADVAIRRIAVDFAAIGRRVRNAAASVMPRWGRKKGDATIDRLKAKRQEYLQQVATKTKSATATTRFEASREFKGKLDMADTSQASPGGKADQPAAPQSPAPQAPQAPAAQPSHLQQLLQAKRRAKGLKNNPDDKGDK